MLNRFLQSVAVIGLDEETAQIFGRERGRLRTAGMMIGDFDLLIGATALQYDLTLLTNNRRHFERIEGCGSSRCDMGGLDHRVGHFWLPRMIAGTPKRPVPLVFRHFGLAQMRLGWPTP